MPLPARKSGQVWVRTCTLHARTAEASRNSAKPTPDAVLLSASAEGYVRRSGLIRSAREGLVTRTHAAWHALLDMCATAFHQPSFAIFQELICAWVLCPGRRTVTNIIRTLGPKLRRAHDSYHRFLRIGDWCMATLWTLLAKHMVRILVRDGRIQLDLDDTLFHKSGRKIDGAGVFRDAVRSTSTRVVYAFGLNLVVLTLRVTAPWGGEPLGLPINLRVYRKGKERPSHIDLAEEMIREVAAWFPDRNLCLCADGAYATLAGRRLPRTQVVSRMRRDAAIYQAPPPRKRGQRGRPRTKGKRLLPPEKLAKRTKRGWIRATVNFRGNVEERLLLVLPVLWYRVCPDRQVLLVIVRHPKGHQPDDFFFTTDLDAHGDAVAACYAGRWSIEVTFRDVKQSLGGQHPQSWRSHGPERAASLSLWLYAAVWTWYIVTQGAKQTWPSLPWYTKKSTPSFVDALAALRRVLWRKMVFSISARRPLTRKIADTLIDALARAA